MNYALFLGCNIPIRIPQYATALTAVFRKFAIELVEEADFNCCGYPARNIDEQAYLLPSVRNLAIAERSGRDIVAVCNCCFASLRKAAQVMAERPEQLRACNTVLAGEGLHYSGKATIRHYLSLLYEEVGAEQIRKALTMVYDDLQIALLYGCHLLRPRRLTGFDDAFVPKIGDELVQLTGATSLDWGGRLECCGAALAGINDPLANTLLSEKISMARAAGAHYITPICAYCYLQLDTAQQKLPASPDHAANAFLPVLLYPQLLGLCLGIDTESLGIAQNSTINADDLEALHQRLIVPVQKPARKAKMADKTDKTNKIKKARETAASA